MLAFLKAEENSPARITGHLNCHAMAELTLKLISVEETPEGMGVLLVGRGQATLHSLTLFVLQ